MNYTENQLKAISTVDKNLQIIACAGSGKTQVISQRIVNIIKSGVKPSEILAFTYTEKAAAELQARVLKLCKENLPEQKGIAEMYVGTIHSWCLKTLQNNKYHYQKYSVLDEVKLKLFLDKNFKHTGMTELNLDRFKDTGHYISLISALRESETLEDIEESFTQALMKYNELLHKNYYFDFSMIMTELIKEVKNDNALYNTLKNEIKYLIVDEYQDVNPIQEEIVKLFNEMGANICVVGDDDQTIFQWRGSDVSYIQTFKDRYHNVEYIRLEDNFRCSKGVIDVALNCITHNTKRLDKSMNALGHQVYERGDILLNQYDNVEDENSAIVNHINNLLGVQFIDKAGVEPRGLDYGDMVILVRKWKKAQPIIEALSNANIPFIVTGVNELFSRPEIQASKAIFQYIKGDIDETILELHWLGLNNHISKEEFNRSLSYLNTKIPNDKTYYEALNLQDIFMTFLEKLGICEEIFITQETENALGYNSEEIIFYNLGMFSQIINDFETIYFKTDPTYKLSSFMSFLQYSAEGYYPEGWLNNTYKTPNAVRIMTIFQSKGLEFPVVFIPGLNNNYLPSSKPTGKNSRILKSILKLPIKDVARYATGEEDERRLFYVGITRAKKFLLLSRSPDGKLQGKESKFLSEIRKSQYLFSAKDRDYKERSILEPQYNGEFANISLNFSLLKSYFDCPYSFKFWSFYGFQSPLGARIGYGSAIHRSLMEIHREAIKGNIIPRENISTLVDSHSNFPYAISVVQEDMTKKAIHAVGVYYDKNLQEFPTIEYAEKDIQIDLGDGIIVNGQMDLIKRKHLDGTEEKIIIDFKSTEDAQAYNATIDQLQLYALGYKELTGENADFLEIYNMDKNDSNKTELSVKELDSMKNKIITAANAIRNNELNDTCNDPKCVCRFKNKRN
ncbi:ATP-dependent helicase [Riemerella anatipestifer]|uniref:ATP-dependent helicase n=1 Tax=Riemerella anatipestifer TaxID=34085 RepID=UPI0023637744|nr:ATP-dependent DNA helicase [Riemerella anatipestifer]MDD1523791.1 ATP-dependent helicase [Riemerella anatipestifer]